MDIHAAPVLMNLLNSLRKRDTMLGKPRILYLFLNSFNKFNKHEHSYKILCFSFYAHISVCLYSSTRPLGATGRNLICDSGIFLSHSNGVLAM